MGAIKERLIAIPGDWPDSIQRVARLNFSDHAVLVKTFLFESPERPRQTRPPWRLACSVREQGEWTGYSYAWNDDQTDAELVSAEVAFVRWK